MQISIKQQEITAAVRAFIAAQGINLDGKEFSVKYTAGRGTDGLTAEIEILNKDMPDFIDEDSAAVADTAIATAAGKTKPQLTAITSEKKDKPADQAPVEPTKGTDPEAAATTGSDETATVGTTAQEEGAATKGNTPSLFS